MTTISPAPSAPPSLPSAAPRATEAATAKATLVAAQEPKAEPKISLTPSPDEVKDAVDQANKKLASTSSSQFQFSIDKETGIDVIKLVDQQTGQTIQQFPSKEMLAIARALDQTEGGALIKQKV